MNVQRRACWTAPAAWALGSLPLARWSPALARLPQAGTRLAAVWDDAQGRHHVGVLGISGGGARPLASLEVPSRAHGVFAEAAGSLLFVARRPGDWLLRWHPARAPQWLWSDSDRRFTGHVLDHAAWPGLLSVEVDLESGQGLVVARDRRTLERQAEWPTSGIDPHQLLADADGTLLLANGGVPTLPETGRVKHHLERMDSSLVRLDPRSGRLLGQWRLDDARLSIRHLARHRSGTVGIALQAEHDDGATKAGAPVLALFDGTRLRSVAAPVPLAGYGGDIAATAEGFAVSVPRATSAPGAAGPGGVAHWTADGRWLGLALWPEACALATAATAARLWAGGRDGAAARTADAAPGQPAVGWDAVTRWSGQARGAKAQTNHRPARPALRLDNHWLVLDGTAG